MHKTLITALFFAFSAGCGVSDAINNGLPNTSSAVCHCDDIAGDSFCAESTSIGPTQALADMNCNNFKMLCVEGVAQDGPCPTQGRHSTCQIDQAAGAQVLRVHYSSGGDPQTAADNAMLTTDCEGDNGTITFN